MLQKQRRCAVTTQSICSLSFTIYKKQVPHDMAQLMIICVSVIDRMPSVVIVFMMILFHKDPFDILFH